VARFLFFSVRDGGRKTVTTMAQAKSGDRVRVHYTGTLEDGTQFDSSAGRDPLEFEVGSGQIIPGFEEAVQGMAAGDKTSITIPPEAAYGPVQDHLVIAVERSQLPADIDPKVGDKLEMEGEERTMVVTVTEVNDAEVTLDANHPLAGKALKFDIELVKIL